MTTDNKSCVNIVKCIGTISEINVELYPNGNVSCAIVLKVVDNYIRFNLFCNKKYNNQLYYQLLEAIGIPHHFISCIDKDKYELSASPIEVDMCGSVKIMKDKKTIHSQVELNRTSKPTKLFLIANINEYGLQVTYIARSKSKEYIDAKLQGIICDDNGTIFIPTDTIVKFKMDRQLPYERGIVYNLNLKWDNGLNIDCNNIISNVDSSGFIIVDIDATDMSYDTNTIDTLIRINEIKHSTRLV